MILIAQNIFKDVILKYFFQKKKILDASFYVT